VEKMLPFLYEENREKPEFSKVNLLLNIFRGFLYGIFNYYFTLHTCLPDAINQEGFPADHFVMSTILYSNILHGVSARILLLTRYFTYYTVLVFVFLSYLLYVMFISIMDTVSGFKSTGAVFIVFTSGRAYINMLFVIGVVSLCDYFTLSIYFNFNKTLSNTLRKIRSKLGSLDDERKMPRKIQEKLEIYKILDEKLMIISQINLGEKELSSVYKLKENENSIIKKQSEEKEIAAYLRKTLQSNENDDQNFNNKNDIISNNNKKIEEVKAIEPENVGENLEEEEEYNTYSKINQIKIIDNKFNENYIDKNLKHRKNYGIIHNDIIVKAQDEEFEKVCFRNENKEILNTKEFNMIDKYY